MLRVAVAMVCVDTQWKLGVLKVSSFQLSLQSEGRLQQRGGKEGKSRREK